jgi:hypothetical protein
MRDGGGGRRWQRGRERRHYDYYYDDDARRGGGHRGRVLLEGLSGIGTRAAELHEGVLRDEREPSPVE